MATVDQTTRNEEAARRWVEEVLNRRNVAAIDELMTQDFEAHPLFHHPYIPTTVKAETWIERQKIMVNTDIMGLENRHTSIDQIIATADKTVTVMTTTGTKDGTPVTYSSIWIARFADGKMVEGWLTWDRLGVYQQLGVLPATPELMKQAGVQT